MSGSFGQVIIVPAAGNTCFMGRGEKCVLFPVKLNKAKINQRQTIVWPTAYIQI